MYKKLIFVLVGLFVAFYTYNLTSIDTTDTLNIIPFFKENISLKYFLISLFCYFIGVIGRSIRLFYLSNKVNLSLRKLIYLQFLSTSFQLTLPFRLGDGARIYLFKNYLEGLADSAFIFIVEKLLDTLTLVSILIFMLWSNKQFLGFLSDSRLIILASIILTFLYVLPDLIDVIYRSSLVSKSNSPLRLFFLKISREILIARNKTVQRLKGRVINILCISYVIWAFDCLSFMFITTALKIDQLYVFVMGSLSALSAFLPSPPLGIYGSVNIGFYWSEAITEIEGLIEYSKIYSIMIYGIFALFTAIVFLLIKSYKPVLKKIKF